jgi:hypothetical protein
VVTVAAEPFADTRQSIDRMITAIRHATTEERSRVELRSWAIDVYKVAGFDGRSVKPSIAQQTQALLDAERAQTSYIADPSNTEWIQAPHATLCLRDVCIPAEDCFPEGTLLLRSDFEFVPIEEIKVGDQIWGRGRWSTVEGKVFKGKLSVDAIEMNNGSTVFLSPDHKAYVGRCKHGRGSECPTCPASAQRDSFERVTVGALQEGDVLLQPDHIDFGSYSPDSDRMYVEGLTLADGWVRQDSHRIFYVAGRDGMRKEAQKHEVKAICDRLGIETRWNPRYIAVKDSVWAERLAGLGSKARFKRLETINLTEAAAAEALRGLMADSTPNSGGKPGGRTYSTTSRMLMLQVRVLHRMFGRSTGYKMLTPEQHGGAGKFPLWRLGVREPSGDRSDKTLKVRSIERSVRIVPCWDIQTDDHYVYLPEHDVTVSNCDGHVVALAAAMFSVGLSAMIVKQDFGFGQQEHVLVGIVDEEGRKLYADPANSTSPVYEGSKAMSEEWIDPLGATGSVGEAPPQLVMLSGTPEREISQLGGVWQERRYGQRWVHDGQKWHGAKTGVGAGWFTPGDVLAYRQTWDPYVMGIVRALYACGALWTTKDPSIDLTHFAVPPDATTISIYASGLKTDGDGLLAQWNKWAGIPDWVVITDAQNILLDLQNTVQSAGQYYAAELKKYCPGIALPTPPGFDMQAQTIGRLEGLGIVAHGLLQLMGIGASGALETAGAIGGGIVAAAKKTLDFTPWLVGGAVVIAGAYIVSQVMPAFRHSR